VFSVRRGASRIGVPTRSGGTRNVSSCFLTVGSSQMLHFVPFGAASLEKLALDKAFKRQPIVPTGNSAARSHRRHRRNRPPSSLRTECPTESILFATGRSAGCQPKQSGKPCCGTGLPANDQRLFVLASSSCRPFASSCLVVPSSSSTLLIAKPCALPPRFSSIFGDFRPPREFVPFPAWAGTLALPLPLGDGVKTAALFKRTAYCPTRQNA